MELNSWTRHLWPPSQLIIFIRTFHDYDLRSFCLRLVRPSFSSSRRSGLSDCTPYGRLELQSKRTAESWSPDTLGRCSTRLATDLSLTKPADVFASALVKVLMRKLQVSSTCCPNWLELLLLYIVSLSNSFHSSASAAATLIAPLVCVHYADYEIIVMSYRPTLYTPSPVLRTSRSWLTGSSGVGLQNQPT